MARIIGIAALLALLAALAVPGSVARGEGEPDAGKVVQGVQLRLESDKEEITMTPSEDGKSFTIEPAKLTLTFINAGKIRIKLIGYDVGWGLVRFDVKGPDGEVASAPAGGRHEPPGAKEKDFPIITPGRSWAPKWEPSFPAKMGPLAFKVTKPGEYKITATYTAEIGHLGLSEFADGSWVNSVKSNTVAVKCVLPGGAAAVGATGLAEPEEQNGLKLTVAASKPALTLRPRDPLSDAGRAARYDVEGFKLKLTFTNTSDKPIKLDAFAMDMERLTLQVRGLRDTSVVKSARKKNPELFEPTEKEFPVIAPGKSWTYDLNLSLPCDVGDSRFALQEPGEYRLRVLYEHAPEAAIDYAELVKGSWDGRVVSNEVLVTCAEAGGPAEPPKDPPLKIEIKTAAKEIALEPLGGGKFKATPAKVTVAFTNTTDKPMKLCLWELDTRHLTFRLVGPDDASVKVSKEAITTVPAAKADDFPTIEPGGGFEFEVPIEFPGTFGGTTWSFLKPGTYRITATYTMDPADCKRSDFAAGCWTGATTSAVLALDAAAEAKD